MSQTFLNQIKQGAIQNWHNYQILPSITASQASLESGWGKSKLAKAPNYNLFGIKASSDWGGPTVSMSTQEYGSNGSYMTTASFRVYDSWSHSVSEHGAFFTNTPWRTENYKNVVGETDYKKASKALQSAGYATDPGYSNKLIKLIEEHKLYEWDKEALEGKPSTAKKVVGGTLTDSAKTATKKADVTLIGDSLGVGTKQYLESVFGSFNADVLGSRQITHATDSLNGTKILTNMKNAGTLKSIVVVILGTNRGVTDAEVDNFMTIAGSNRKVIWVDTNSSVSHKGAVATAYKKASDKHANAYYANWSVFSNNLRSRYYSSDDIHMNSEGYRTHASFIQQAVYESTLKASQTTDTNKTELININDIVYNQDGFVSIAGESAVYNSNANQNWYFKFNGESVHPSTILEIDSDDPQELLEAGLQHLKDNAEPLAQYTINLADIPFELSIGDTGLFIDHNFNPPLYLQGRVLSITTSSTDPSRNQVVIGNTLEVRPADKTDILKIQKELQDTRNNLVNTYRQGKPVILRIDASNGSILKEGLQETTLVATAFKDDEDITGNITRFEWTRDTTGAELDEADETYNVMLKETNTTPSLNIKELDVSIQATFTVRAYIDNNLIAQNSTVIKNILDPRYTHIVYADDEAGNGISTNPNGKDYVGISYNKRDSETSLNKDDYVFEPTITKVVEEVDQAIKEAEQAKANAVKAYEDAVAEAKRSADEADALIRAEIEQEIATIETEVSEAKQEAIDASNQALEDAKAHAIAQDTALKTSIQGEISEVETELLTAKQEATTATNKALADAKAHAIAQDTALKTSIQSEINTVEAELSTAKQEAINASNKALTDAKAHAIAQDTALKTLLQGEINGAEAEATAAKQAAQKAYTDAVAEAEAKVQAKDTEYKLIFGGYDSTIESIEADSQTAKTKAEQALADVGISSDLAQTAKNLATTAQTEVDTVKGTVSGHTTTLSQHASQISARLTSSQVNSLVDGKGFATQTYADTKIEAKAGQVTTSLTSLVNTKATQSDIDTSILNDKTIKDTRNDNQTPSWYYTNYPKQKVLEFKTATVVGINQTNTTYVLLETDVPWTGNSGGYVTQTATSSTTKWIRRGNSTTWSAWVEQADVTYVNTKVTTTANGIEQLITQVKTNPTGTITGYNSLKNNVDSMVQAIGSDGGKIAQMVMTDSLFSTKVLEQVQVGGANLIKNSEDLSNQMPGYSGVTSTVVPIDMTNEWGFSQAYDVYLQGGDYAMKSVWTSSNRVTEPMTPGQQYTHSFWIKNLGSSNSLQIATNGLEPNKTITLAPGESIRYQHTGVRRQDYDWYQIHFRSMTAGSNIRFAIGRFKLEKGNVATDWSPAPEEKANQSEVTQLSNSWALTLKSGNDIKTQINASTDSIRLSSKFIHLNGNSLIDNATIKSAHIDTLNASKITGTSAEFNTIRAGVLTANAVTATHINANTALFDTLFSTASATNRLVAQGAWITNANIVSLDASKITAGTIDTARLNASAIVTAGLTADVVTSTHIKSENALIDTIFANQALVDRLWAKTIWTNKINAMSLNASQITAGTIATARLNASEIVTNGLTADVVTSTHIKAENALIDTIFGTQALVDRLWAKTIWTNKINAMSLDAARITSGTISTARLNVTDLRTKILTADTIDATQINGSTALFDKLFSTTSATTRLVAQGAWITNANIVSLNASKITAGTIATARLNASEIVTNGLTANVVTSTHIKADTALFDTLFSTTSATSRLVAQGAWIENANIIGINASKITAGTISASRISTSSLANLEIGGTNLAGGSPSGWQSRTFSVGSWLTDLTEQIPISSMGLKAGDTITLSIELEAGSRPVSTRIEFFKNNTERNAVYGNQIKNGTGVSSLTTTIPADRPYIIIRLQPDVAPVVTAYTIKYRRYKLEKGNKATDWSPAPEDITNDLKTSGKVEIHGGNIKANTLDVGKITGDKASFFQTSWEGLNSNVTVDSSKVRLTNSSKDFIEMNGIPELRSQDSAGTSAIMGKGRSHYYSGSQARFYIGSNLEGLAQYGVHIAKGQTFGIYRNSNTYGGTPAQYHVVVKGESWRSITTKYWNDSTSVDVLMKLNGYNVNNYPDLYPGDTVLIKAAVAGNESGVERLWTMGTSSSGATRLYSHPEHVFEYRIEVQDRARFIAKALFEDSFTNNSDRRIKHDIKDTEVRALDHLGALTFKEYKLNSNGKTVPLGLIAQDSGILRVKGEDEGDYEGIDGLLMPMLAMKGVQELHAIVKQQAEEIRQLKEIINNGE